MAVALVHYPCLDARGGIVTTSITNLNVHDIARAATTYGVDAFYIVTPIGAQRDMAATITGYWDSAEGRARNPSRTEAMKTVHIVSFVHEAIAAETLACGAKPLVAANGPRGVVTCTQLRERVQERGLLVLFGAGFGLAPSVLEETDVVLEPLPGRLSARATASIVLDRLLA